MTTLTRHSPALRIAATVAGGLLLLLVGVALVRPDMMAMVPMLQRLVVGFGL